MLDFGEAVRRFYANYTNASGRAQRSAYWWVLLYQVIIYSVLAIVIYMADGGAEFYSQIGGFLEGENIDFDVDLGPSGIFALILGLIFALVNLLPDIMLSIRRFHDLGQTGWLVLIFMILSNLPGIGFMVDLANMIWFGFRGTSGPNQYGPDPLGNNTDIFS